MTVLEDLKQKKVVEWGLAYLAGAWLMMQLFDVLGARWGIYNSTARVVDVLLIFGLFITIVVAWYHGDRGRVRGDAARSRAVRLASGRNATTQVFQFLL